MKNLCLLLLTGLLFCSCTQPDRELAPLQRYYAEQGEKMISTSNRVEQKNPQKGTTPHLSTTNRPVGD